MVCLGQTLQKMQKMHVICLRSLGEAGHCGGGRPHLQTLPPAGPGAEARLGSGWGLGAAAPSPPAPSQGGCAVPAPRGGMQVGDPGCVCLWPPCPGHCAWLAGMGERRGAGGTAASPEHTGMQQSAVCPRQEPGATLPTATLPANGPSKGWQSVENSVCGPGRGSQVSLRACTETASGPTLVWFGGYRNTTPQLLTCGGRGAAVPV